MRCPRRNQPMRVQGGEHLMRCESGGNPVPGAAVEVWGEGGPAMLAEAYTARDDKPRQVRAQQEGGAGGRGIRHPQADLWLSVLVSAARPGTPKQRPPRARKGGDDGGQGA